LKAARIYLADVEYQIISCGFAEMIGMSRREPGGHRFFTVR
jgi:hypothetical protein